MQAVLYTMELKHNNISKRDDLEFLKMKISKGCTLEVNNKYQEKRKKTWHSYFKLEKLY